MKAAVLHQPYDIRIEEKEEPKIGPKDLLIKNIHTGVCGTDVNHYKGFWEGEKRDYPFVPGHEYSGVVAEVGAQLCDFQIGDKVYGIQGGSLSQSMVITPERARALGRLPKDASLADFTSMGPIGGTLSAIKKSRLKIGDRVAILGPGHAGLILMQWARISGAEQVIVTGTRENRLQVARDLGADFTVNIRKEDPVQKVKEYTGGIGADVVVEATGRPDAIVQAVNMVKTNGTIVIFGVAQEAVEQFDAFQIYSRCITMLGTRGRTDEERIIGERFLLSGKLSVKPIITHTLPLEETKRGFEMVDKRLDGVIRMVIQS